MLGKIKTWFQRNFGTPENETASRSEAEPVLIVPNQEDILLHLMLFKLLPDLENKGIVLSPDRYIRLERLINALPKETPLADWRNYLCPVLATDESQQLVFYVLFDKIFLEITPQKQNLPAKKETPEKDNKTQNTNLDESKTPENKN
jgi:hypothetical protein